MVDLVKIRIKAGDGGDGRISFHRAKFIPKGGPDGGDGGDGGNVFVRGNRNLHSLRDFAGVHEIAANNGQGGGREKSFGAKGDDITIDLPLGTRVYKVVESFVPIKKRRMYWIDRDTGRHERTLSSRRSQSPLKIVSQDGVFTLQGDNTLAPTSTPTTLTIGNRDYLVTLVGEITAQNQSMLVAKAGKGGKGNWVFRSSTNTTPREAETGEGGEHGEFIFELQVLADVALIGYPNVGKSTLLSVLTKASPKIANYPFTTLEPNLGVLEFPSNDPSERQSLLIADIPGVIEGAHEGKGLGLEFLRHIHRCKIFLFVLGLDDTTMMTHADNPQALVDSLQEQFAALHHELQSYATKHGQEYVDTFMDKHIAVAVNKVDLLTQEQQEELVKAIDAQFPDALLLSAKTQQGIDDLKNFLRKFV